jgi:PTS system nitrogen regulatory IIA component
MELYEILDKRCCSVSLTSRTKDDVLRELAALSVRNEALRSFGVETVYKALKQRESEGTTGFGDGVALPHMRLKGLKRFLVLIATSKTGVDFDALDKKKVSLFFVIIGPAEKVNEHVQILASISRALGTTRIKKELLQAKTEGVLYETFLRSVEKSIDTNIAKRKMKLMYVVLYLEEFLYHILEYFIQEGIDGATIIESSGMGAYISNIPLFATFIGFFNERKNQSKTIMALVPEEREREIIEGIEKITGDLDKKEGAMIITTDVSIYRGSMKILG